MKSPSRALGDLTALSACELSRLVQQKQVSPVEVLAAHLKRIEESNPAINAFTWINSEQALSEAKHAESLLMSGETKPLLGVPVTIKSCIDVAGFPAATGSHLRKNYVAAQDAPLVARLKQAGAVVIGNTNTPEFLVAYHTDNDLYGKTSNPWDLARTAGGSSGGEAAAISCGMSAAGIGSDGGGSVRVPAHFCGICGLKPTPGRIPATGHYPPCGGPFSLIGVVGPMARTVEDLQLLLEITSGYDAGDPVSAPLPPPVTNPQLDPKLKIGFYEEDGYSPPTPATKAAVRAAAHALAQHGFPVEPFRPAGLDRARELWFTIFVEAIAMAMKDTVQGHEDETTANTKEFLEFAAQQPPLTGERLLNTLLERDGLRSNVLPQMESFPILLAPVCSVPAFRHGEGGWGAVHPADYVQTMSYSQHYNLLGNPAAVVPVGQSPEGLPIAVQIIGRPYKEDEVLSVARILDEQFGWRLPH
jgi:Asp-tRNA(Asn)/Glu-tRNA(Gln) amidotransferase A subunit family amidase